MLSLFGSPLIGFLAVALGRPEDPLKAPAAARRTNVLLGIIVVVVILGAIILVIQRLNL